MTERYEELRAAALGEPLAVEARSGLALLLRRGMLAWTRAASAPKPTQQLPRSPAPTSADPEQRAVVRLLAALAMRTMHGGTHERFT